nr:hypothetical protein [Tanacetum cinerariifolium]
MYRASNLKSIKTLNKELETLKEEKDVVDGKLARELKSSKDLENLIESQRSDKVKEGVEYNAVPPPAADLYLSPKKDLSWTGLPEFIDDTKPTVKYAKMYRRPSKKPTVRGNHRNWNNLKTQQLGSDLVMKKKTCYNCGDFNNLAYDYRKRVKRGTSGSQNGAPMRPPHRPADHRPHGAPMRPPNRPVGHRPHEPPMRPTRSNMNGARPNRTSFNKQAHSYSKRPFQETT